MTTEGKYREMGIIEIGDGRVIDKTGTVYYPRKSKSPLKAIKYYCRECMGACRRSPIKVQNFLLVAECTDPMCPLYDFRQGQNPFLRDRMTPEQRMEAAVRLNAARFLHKKRDPENSGAF